MNRIFALAVAAHAVFAGSCAGVPTNRAGVSAERAIESVLAEHLAGTAVTGATAALVLADGSRFQGVWGVLAEDAGEPMPVDARMLAGSTGKTLFGVALLQLAEVGTLTLDDPLVDHLGDLPWFDEIPNADAITLRHLANHTSGLRDHVWFDSFQRAIRDDPARTWGHEELARQIAGSEPLFKPGDGWAYSDSNHVLLGLVLERASGRDAYELIREQVIQPLGLTGTSPSDRAELPGLVGGTTSLGDPFGIGPITAAGGVYAMNPQWEWAGGGYVSTSADLAMLFHAIWTSDLLDESSREALLDYTPATLAPGSGYSVGMIRLPTPAGEGHGHLGIMPGYLTYAMHFPERGVSVALQINADGPGARARQLVAAHALTLEAIDRASALEPRGP